LPGGVTGGSTASISTPAGLVVPAGRREWLERVCRYTLRPPVSDERLAVMADGRVHLSLKQPWRDGTTALVFDPVEVLGRLAVLVPRPRLNLLMYFGVLGARAAWRAEVVPRVGTDAVAGAAASGEADEPGAAETVERRARGLSWAALMQRTFGFDVLACSACGGHSYCTSLRRSAG
jgi:hypothetical protein